MEATVIEPSGEAYEKDNDLPNSARLGFNEIIPGLSSAPEEHSVQPDQDIGIHIPEFDLGQHMMARHRRAATAMRRGPGQQKQADVEPEANVQAARPKQAQAAWSTVTVPQHNAIIADIVARDLARLCGARWRP
jgi:hypothetical protein